MPFGAVRMSEPRNILWLVVERERSLLGAAAEIHRRALERESKRAEAAERRYAFLHEANAVLAAAPDGFAALASAARLAVPALADACFVDLVEDDGVPGRRIRRFAVERSGGVEGRVERDSCHPLDADAAHGTPRVLRTGQPELIPEVPDGLLVRLAGGEGSGPVPDLAPASYLCVPLQAGLRLIGTMGLISSRARRRRYGPEDLILVQCLARCTALVAVGLLGWSRDPRRALRAGAGEPALTPRQLEVLRLLDGGMRVQNITSELRLSEPTVRTHVRAILRAFGARSQLEALHKARTLGLVEGTGGRNAPDLLP